MFQVNRFLACFLSFCMLVAVCVSVGFARGGCSSPRSSACPAVVALEVSTSAVEIADGKLGIWPFPPKPVDPPKPAPIVKPDMSPDPEVCTAPACCPSDRSPAACDSASCSNDGGRRHPVLRGTAKIGRGALRIVAAPFRWLFHRR